MNPVLTTTHPPRLHQRGGTSTARWWGRRRDLAGTVTISCDVKLDQYRTCPARYTVTGAAARDQQAARAQAAGHGWSATQPWRPAGGPLPRPHPRGPFVSNLCGTSPAIVGVHWYPYYCPVCDGGRDDPSCLYCHRLGLITAEQAAGWLADGAPLRPVPRPPGVRRTPCKGSPEQQEDYELESVLQQDKPFWCHVDLPVVNGAYTVPLELSGGIPLGLLVCAGWFDWMSTGRLPRHSFIDDESDTPKE